MRVVATIFSLSKSESRSYYHINYSEELGFNEEDYRKAPGAIIEFPIKFEEYENFHDREELESEIES